MELLEMQNGFDQVPMGGGGVYFEPGNYQLKIIEAKNGKAPNAGFSFFVVEFEIITSTNPMRPAGSRVQFMVAFKQPNYLSTYQADVKQFLFNAFAGIMPGLEEQQVTQQVWNLATSQNQPLANCFVAATAVSKKKKYSDGDFTKVNFAPWWPEGVARPQM